MFAPAQVIEAEVYAQLPESLHWKGKPSEWLSTRPWGHIGSFLEGVNFGPDGSLYCVDLAFGRVFKVDGKGDFELVHQYEGEPNGLRFDPTGQAFIADVKHGILKLDIAAGCVTGLVSRADEEPFKGPNDLVFAPNGDLFFTDMGRSDLAHPDGRLIRVRKDGSVQVLVDCIPGPNGLTLNRAGNGLLVAVTRANAVWQVILLPDGNVFRTGHFCQLAGGVGPDGLALDREGNVIIAHAGTGSVVAFSPTGEPLYRVRSAAGALITNLTFSPDDPHDIFMTEASSGTILKARVPIPGDWNFAHGVR